MLSEVLSLLTEVCLYIFASVCAYKLRMNTLTWLTFWNTGKAIYWKNGLVIYYCYRFRNFLTNSDSKRGKPGSHFARFLSAAKGCDERLSLGQGVWTCIILVVTYAMLLVLSIRLPKSSFFQSRNCKGEYMLKAKMDMSSVIL